MIELPPSAYTNRVYFDCIPGMVWLADWMATEVSRLLPVMLYSIMCVLLWQHWFRPMICDVNNVNDVNDVVRIL